MSGIAYGISRPQFPTPSYRSLECFEKVSPSPFHLPSCGDILAGDGRTVYSRLNNIMEGLAVEKNLNGLFLYASNYFFDGSDTAILDQMNEVMETRDDIKLAIIDECAWGHRKNERFLILEDGTRLYEKQGNLPAWAIIRSNDWRFADHLERMGIRCFPSADIIRLCQDKVLTHSFFAGRIPQPDTLYCKGNLRLLDMPEDEIFPMMVKDAFGTYGVGVYKVNSMRSMHNAERVLGNQVDTIYQKPCPTGDDLRVYILGNEIVYKIVRRCAEGEYKANVDNGGYPETYEGLNKTDLQVIRRAVEALPGEHGFMCLDFLFNERGRIVFNELNSSPGIKQVMRMFDDGDTIMQRYVDYADWKCGVGVDVFSDSAVSVAEVAVSASGMKTMEDRDSSVPLRELAEESDGNDGNGDTEPEEPGMPLVEEKDR